MIQSLALKEYMTVISTSHELTVWLVITLTNSHLTQIAWLHLNICDTVSKARLH